ncbi:EamA family transporter [Paractinoplanes atraurantiacus]|uniref:EamA-like transporter family protein n=1 Tax=Paractinoplanes atraurantiacus TaxID=1036182 RepID=A0A285JM31_9ACTN|nr:EamA family transporter [Actinoplanes atraurantiacus]SNY61359.1 EamA-like transporter family protein [Actinoplanes atraurantiacus]
MDATATAWVMTTAVLAAVGWGTSDFLAGALTRRVPLLTILIGSQIAAMILVLPVAVVRGLPPAWDARLWLGAAAGLIGLPAMGLLYRAMRDGSPAVVAPVAAIAALIPVGWGLLHGQRVGAFVVVGVAAGLAGATMASWPVPGLPRSRPRWPAAVCALGAAVGFGAFFVLLHEAGEADEFWAVAIARISAGVAATALAVLLGQCRPTLFQPKIFLVGASDVGADAAFIVAAASALAPTAVVASLYPAVTLLLNRLVLRERLHTIHLYGVVSAVFAVACLAR